MTHSWPEDDAPTPPNGFPSPVPRERPAAPARQRPEPPHDARAGGSFAGDLARAAPKIDAADAIGVARVAGAAVWRVVSAVTRRSVGAATEIAKEVQAGEPVAQIIDRQVQQVRSAAVHALGLDTNGRMPVVGSIPVVGSLSGTGSSTNRSSRAANNGMSAGDLKDIGNAMLRYSWNASNQPKNEHPAFAAMLQALTPDEIRILRFLAVAGPQPSVDVRSKTPFGIGSERLAGGMNMIADMAGCSYPDHDHHYLANLNRLGLVRFSEEPVADFRRYSLIEAQPKVAEAMEKVKKATTVYRSIYLSLFGQQFCQACFDLEGYDAGGWAQDDRGDKIIGKGPPTVKKKHH